MSSFDVAQPTIDVEFAKLLVQCFNSQDMPVHMLFNHWWSDASPEVTLAYVEEFLRDAGERIDSVGAKIADAIDLESAGALPEDSLGRAYYRWIIENGLQANIATDYRTFHEGLVAAGLLKGMPEAMQKAVLRGFQVHDFQHVLTGYDSSGPGEIALQAFCLAQTKFPYFGMWMSVITTQMTLLNPAMIQPMMDAISDGWTHGRSASSLALEPWESMLDEPLGDLRSRYGIDCTPRPGTVFTAR